jgi:hypothetical protein
LPSIVWVPRVTLTVDRNREARCTNCAAALACSPNLFATVTDRDGIVLN